jgi:hypothetical protein
VGHGTLVGSQVPLLSKDKLARLQGACCVPVLEDGFGQVISVVGASLGFVAPDQPVCLPDGYL